MHVCTLINIDMHVHGGPTVYCDYDYEHVRICVY